MQLLCFLKRWPVLYLQDKGNVLIEREILNVIILLSNILFK